MNTYTRRGRAPLIFTGATAREILSIRGPHSIKIEEERTTAEGAERLEQWVSYGSLCRAVFTAADGSRYYWKAPEKDGVWSSTTKRALGLRIADIRRNDEENKDHAANLYSFWANAAEELRGEFVELSVSAAIVEARENFFNLFALVADARM